MTNDKEQKAPALPRAALEYIGQGLRFYFDLPKHHSAEFGLALLKLRASEALDK